MKKYNSIVYVLMMMGITLFCACEKNDIQDTENFKVNVSKLTYKVGDIVTFNFEGGDANQIVFYSGEVGKTYNNRQRLSQAGINKLKFETSMQQGLLTDNDSLRLMISTNLAGYDSLSVVKAKWTDITARNTKWPTALNTSYTISDDIDISDFNTQDKINIAFRFLGKKKATQAQRRWQIRNLALSNLLADGTLTNLFAAPFTNLSTPTPSSFQFTGWVQVSIKNNKSIGINAWDVGTAGVTLKDSVRNSNGIAIRTAYPLQFNPGTEVNVDNNDDWLITSAVDLKTVRPDGGVSIKNKISNVLTQYFYKCTTPGTYKVTFVALNEKEGVTKSVVREMQIEILP